MSTTPAPYPTNYRATYGTDPYGTNLNYQTSDPRKIASQQRSTSAAQYAQGNQQAQGTQDFLGGIENPLAQGQGGYNASETSQIELSPQDKQNIITGAGISAGANTAASVGAAERAANASGGNPMALAAYRARAAQQQGAQAGDAMTQARIGAQQAGAQGAEQVGQARIGQQNQALGYYGNLQSQQNQNAQNAANRGTQASQLGFQASQTPSTFDKTVGAVGGALSFLDEGGVSGSQTPAVVGEHGPEKVVTMDDGGFGEPAPPSQSSPIAGTPSVPFWKKIGNAFAAQQGAPTAPVPGSGQWSPISTYQTLGKLAGAGVRMMGDGGMGSGSNPNGDNGIFTSPTRVNLSKNEAVVPLSYRAQAKVRPSMASLPAAKVTNNPYRGRRAAAA